MNRRDRRKQKKKQERQEQLRREKHLRQSTPAREDQARPEERRPDDAETPSRQDRMVLSRVGVIALPPHGPSLDATLAPEPSPSTTSAAAPAEGAGEARPPQVLDNFFVGDPARKWLDTLLAGTDANLILHALEPAELLPGEFLLKASVCCEILVAAEVVAAGRGRPSQHLPEPVAAWLRERDMLFSPGVVALANAAVRRVGEFSELRHLWDTVHLAPEWLRGVEALIGRLS